MLPTSSRQKIKLVISCAVFWFLSTDISVYNNIKEMDLLFRLNIKIQKRKLEYQFQRLNCVCCIFYFMFGLDKCINHQNLNYHLWAVGEVHG